MADGEHSPGPGMLTNKLGPLPVWGWAAVIVAAAVAARVYKSRTGAATTAAPLQADLLGGSGSSPLAGGGTTTAGGLPTFANNAAWRAASFAFLVLTGADPITAESALTRWFGGHCLDAQELAAVGLALGHYGPPPNGGQPEPTPCATVTNPPGVNTGTPTPPPPVTTGPVPLGSGVPTNVNSLPSPANRDNGQRIVRDPNTGLMILTPVATGPGTHDPLGLVGVGPPGGGWETVIGWTGGGLAHSPGH